MLAQKVMSKTVGGSVRLGLASSSVRSMSSIPWATLDPKGISSDNVAVGQNLLNGKWTDTAKYESIPDPLTGKEFIRMPDTSESEAQPFIEKMLQIPKHGLHNPYKNVDRYRMYGDISHRCAAELRKPEVADFFTRLVQRVSPKSYAQAMGEVVISRIFFENYSGDQVRFLARSFQNPGDHDGQISSGYRWPYGPTALITPFNFPLEIPVLQAMASLYMGNHLTFKTDSKVAIVMDQCFRMMIHCGLPPEDLNFINSNGPVMNKILMDGKPKVTLFTGSQAVAEKLAKDLNGKIKVEDAGFDWKILGPDVQQEEYVAWQCDQDAYACSGQKCSAQSILFMHENWGKTDLLDRMAKLASRRKLEDLTVGPVLTVSTERFLDHVKKLTAIPGAKVLFGGEELENHTIHKAYGAVKPTAVFVPISEIVKPENFETVTTEVFAPIQVVTEYKENELHHVLDCLERLEAHLTAAVVSNDIPFQQKVLAHSVNGTTYCGIRARTTGAPQNHWFGPAGDPRAGALGPPEAVRLVWSCHREIIRDEGPVPSSWSTPEAT